MSSSISVPLRARWAARSMILSRWLFNTGHIELETPICEINTDGQISVVRCTTIMPTDYGVPVWGYVREGHEVGPLGQIMEYTTNASGSGVSPRERLHSTARTVLRRRDAYPKIFINYRQADTEAYAWRLHETLTQRYGKGSVFLDQFSIRPGEAWQWVLQQAVVHCDVMISLIGPHWMPWQDPRKPRVDNPTDLVRREICAALDRGTVVMPLLTPRGEVPAYHLLPDDLIGLEELQYLNLSARNWDSDLRSLLEGLDEAVGAGGSTGP